MKNGFFLAALLLTLYIPSIKAAEARAKFSFMPENKMKISTSARNNNDMTKEKFESIIKRVYDSYAPIVKERGATLIMENNWEDGTVNAYADQYGTTWIVYMYGGLARHSLVTDDGFLLVVCHETGHHLGGAPKYGDTVWASNEGQSDYFGTLKCLKRIFEKDDNISIVAAMTIDAEAARQCNLVYKVQSESALCQRIAMAGKSVALLLGEFEGRPAIAFDTPDPGVVTKTYDNHPKAQCRLDTYFNGALCDKNFLDDVSDSSPVPGTCTKSEGYTIGLRPLCWYKPGCDELTEACQR